MVELHPYIKNVDRKCSLTRRLLQQVADCVNTCFVIRYALCQVRSVLPTYWQGCNSVNCYVAENTKVACACLTIVLAMKAGPDRDATV